MRLILKAVICTPDYINISQTLTTHSKAVAIDNFMTLVESIATGLGTFDTMLYEVREII